MTIGMLFTQGATTANERLMDRVVVAHVRSLQADHLKDVLKAVTPAVRVEPDRHPKPKPLKPAREIAG